MKIRGIFCYGANDKYKKEQEELPLLMMYKDLK